MEAFAYFTERISLHLVLVSLTSHEYFISMLQSVIVLYNFLTAAFTPKLCLECVIILVIKNSLFVYIDCVCSLNSFSAVSFDAWFFFTEVVKWNSVVCAFVYVLTCTGTQIDGEPESVELFKLGYFFKLWLIIT